MSTLMHFRKRQLLEYQCLSSLGLLDEPIVQAEYPSSPSSLHSGKSSPVGDVPDPRQSPNNKENSKVIKESPREVEQPTYPPKEEAVEESTNTNNNLDSTPVQSYQIWTAEETAAATALLTLGIRMKQSLAQNFYRENDEVPQIEPKPSTLLLAKLNQLKEQQAERSKDTRKSTDSAYETDSNALQESPKHVIEVKQLSPYGEHINNLYDIIGVPAPPVKEQRKLADPKDFQDVQIKPEPTQPNDDLQRAIYNSSKPDQQQKVKLEDFPPFKQTINRITSVFDTVNNFERRIQDLTNKGINVEEKNYTINSQPKTTNNGNSPSAPLQVQEQYNYTPTTSKRPQTTKNQKTTRRPAHFVHITADTLPEELLEMLTASAHYNQPMSSTPKDLTKSKQTRSPSLEISSIQKDSTNDKYPYPLPDNDNLLVIGPNGTLMTRTAWSKIDWTLPAPAITRKILMEIFDRQTLATHSLTGRPSPAFKDLNKPEKQPLDTEKVADTVYIITSRTNTTPKEVRMAITTKCADECKMLKWRAQRNLRANFSNKENQRMKPY